jgi:hypothetical protein
MNSLLKQIMEVRASKGREWRDRNQKLPSSSLSEQEETTHLTRYPFDEINLPVQVITFIEDVETIINFAQTCSVNYKAVFSNPSIFENRSYECLVPTPTHQDSLVQCFRPFHYVETRMVDSLTRLDIAGHVENEVCKLELVDMINSLKVYCSSCRHLVLKNVRYTLADLQDLLTNLTELKHLELDSCLMEDSIVLNNRKRRYMKSFSVIEPRRSQFIHYMDLKITGIENLSLSCDLNRNWIEKVITENINTLEVLKLTNSSRFSLNNEVDLSRLKCLSISGVNARFANDIIKRASGITSLELSDYKSDYVGSATVEELIVNFKQPECCIKLYEIISALKQKYSQLKKLCIGAGIINFMAANVMHANPTECDFARFIPESSDLLTVDCLVVDIADLSPAHKKALEMELKYSIVWKKIQWKRSKNQQYMQLSDEKISMLQSILEALSSSTEISESDQTWLDFILCAACVNPKEHTLEHTRLLYDTLSIRDKQLQLIVDTESTADTVLGLYQSVYGNTQEVNTIQQLLLKLQLERSILSEKNTYTPIPGTKYQLDALLDVLKQKISQIYTEYGAQITNEAKFFDINQWDAPDAIDILNSIEDDSEWEWLIEGEEVNDCEKAELSDWEESELSDWEEEAELYDWEETEDSRGIKRRYCEIEIISDDDETPPTNRRRMFIDEQ